MTYHQSFTAPDGTKLVVLSRADYDRLLAASGEDAGDIQAADTARADPTRYPAAVVDRILAGKTPVAAWRAYRGMTQSRLAEAAGMIQAGIARLEHLSDGKMPWGRYQTRAAIAAALEIPVAALDPLDVY